MKTLFFIYDHVLTFDEIMFQYMIRVLIAIAVIIAVAGFVLYLRVKKG